MYVFDVIDNIFHGFASVCITYILIYRDISIIYFSFALFSPLKGCFIFATLVRPFFHGRSLDYFYELIICKGVVGVCWYMQDSSKIGLW